ncbi:hypothetical protein ACFWDQ_20775 [Streptomyces sp. NPDC060053]|uniref:hypothetical protein n=1 Tax=Streptomyces sp. NPDC060053 TaxID=3347047 RepID=UPI0036A08C10
MVVLPEPEEPVEAAEIELDRRVLHRDFLGLQRSLATRVRVAVCGFSCETELLRLLKSAGEAQRGHEDHHGDRLSKPRSGSRWCS